MNPITQKLMERHLYKSIDPESEYKGTSLKDRILPTTVAAILSGAGGYGVGRLLKRFDPEIFTNPKAYGLVSSSLGAGGGFFYPDLHNAVLKHKKGQLSKKDVEQAFSRIRKLHNRINLRAGEVYSEAKDFQKTAFIGSAIRLGGGLVRAGLKAGSVGAGLFAQGLKPVAKTAPIGSKVFGATTKGLALTGVGGAGYAGYNAIQAPRSGSNYTTFLRNNILAGNIKPGELSQNESASVQKLGMR